MLRNLLIFIGVLFALQIGGCALLIGWAFWESSQLPDYINRASISEMHGGDIATIHNSLKQHISLKHEDAKVNLSDNILAIFAEINAQRVDLYGKYDAQLGSHFSSNGAGRASLTLNGRTEKCMTYDLEVDDTDYLLCMRLPEVETTGLDK